MFPQELVTRMPVNADQAIGDISSLSRLLGVNRNFFPEAFLSRAYLLPFGFLSSYFDAGPCRFPPAFPPLAKIHDSGEYMRRHKDLVSLLKSPSRLSHCRHANRPNAHLGSDIWLLLSWDAVFPRFHPDFGSNTSLICISESVWV